MQLFSKSRVHKCVTDGRTDGRTDGQTDRRTVGQTDRQTDSSISKFLPTSWRGTINDISTMNYRRTSDFPFPKNLNSVLSCQWKKTHIFVHLQWGKSFLCVCLILHRLNSHSILMTRGGALGRVQNLRRQYC